MKKQRNNSRAKLHEHAGSLHDVIDLLSSKLTTESIMTPWSVVDCVETSANGREAKPHAAELMKRHEYSAVPIVRAGEVVGTFVRHKPGIEPTFESLQPGHFVGADMGLIQLIRHMRDAGRIAVGVGSAEQPLGWVTYADFSKRPFRVILFTIVAEVEYFLASGLDATYADGGWARLLLADKKPNRGSVGELLVRRLEAAHWDVTMPLTTFAEIGHLIQAVEASPELLKLLDISEEAIDRLRSIPELRNRVSHVVRPVVAGPKQIAAVANQIDLMLEWIDRWSKRLADTPGVLPT